MAKTKQVKRGDAGSATGPTVSTGVVEDSFIEDGVEDSSQVGTNDGDARWAARSGNTAGVEHDGNTESATGPTAFTGVVEDSFVEDGVDDSAQVGTNNGDARWAAGSGNTAGVEHDGDEGSATGPTALTCIDEKSFVEDGVDDSEQVGTDDGIAKRAAAAGGGDTAGKEDSNKVAVEQNGESLFSTLPNSDATSTNNLLPGPSSGNSNNTNNTNAVVRGVSAHIEKGKKTVITLRIYFIRSSGADYSDFK